jgi:hypothetical protein
MLIAVDQPVVAVERHAGAKADGARRRDRTFGQFIGPATLAVVLRVLGLLLAALSIQSIVSGLQSLMSWTA